mmetsp:Transcript_52310/g.122892  ORF Transcript_52310/g.122892 Transcript_52310/m.122892 type:complete len:416 (-) Transcript_52310:223-1470(-)
MLLTSGSSLLRLLCPIRRLDLDHLSLGRGCGPCAEVRLVQHIGEAQGHWNHRRDVRLGAIDFHSQSELVAGDFQLLQALQIVRAGSATPDVDLVFLDLIRKHLKSLDQACESGRDVSEVCDTSSDDQELALWVLVAAHQGEDCLGIREGLLCGGSSRIFSIIGQLLSPAVVRHGVRVHNRCATTSYHGPDTALIVEDGQLQGSTGLPVQLSNEGLFRIGSSTKRRWPIQFAPLLGAQERSSLVDLCDEVQGHYLVVREQGNRIDLEVCEVQVAVEGKKCLDEAREGCALARLHLVQELRANHVLGNLATRGDGEPGGLCIDIADIHATLMVEEYLVLIPVRLHADVDLLGLRMWHERLDQEVRELPCDATHGCLLAHPLHDPSLDLIESLVHRDEAGFSSASDHLVRLGHELLCL